MAKRQKQSDSRQTYPCYPLKRAISLAEALKECGGARIDVPKGMLAQRLKMAKTAGALFQLISTAKCFGIIEGNRVYRLTESGKRYFLPTTESDRRESLLGFYNEPSVFQSLIRQFNGETLPETGMLANMLTHGGQVPESWATRVAGIFKSAGREIGVIDEDGRLNYKCADKEDNAPVTDAPEIAEPQSRDRPGAQPPKPNEPLLVRPGVNVWVYNEAGNSVRVETSDPLSLAMWERLMHYVEVLHPSSGTRKEGANGNTKARRG